MAPPLHCPVVKRPQQYFILTHITAEQIVLLKKLSLKVEKKQRRALFLKHFCVLWCFQLPPSTSIHSGWQQGYMSRFWKLWQKPGEGSVKGVAWIYTDKRKADLIIFYLPPPPFQLSDHFAEWGCKLCADARQFSPGSGNKYLQARVQSETTINTHSCPGSVTSLNTHLHTYKHTPTHWYLCSPNPYSLQLHHSSDARHTACLVFQWCANFIRFHLPAHQINFSPTFATVTSLLFHQNRTNTTSPALISKKMQKPTLFCTKHNLKSSHSETSWNAPGHGVLAFLYERLKRLKKWFTSPKLACPQAPPSKKKSQTCET